MFILKASIAVFGRFHAFNLAQQLQQHGHLCHLMTTYPNFAISKFGVDISAVNSIWHLDLLERIYRKLPASIRKQYNSQLWFNEQFDQAVLPYIRLDSDIFVGWSGACLKAFQRAKELGARTVVERGSSHMIYQTKILEEEYEYWGLKFTETHPGVYERELQAYDQVDRIAIPSQFVKQTFLEQGIPESRLIHVPYGVSLREFYPIPKDDKVFRVIHCGQISLRKGIPYLLEAFHDLNLPNAELWLVGSLNPEIIPFVEKYQSERIILKGTYPQSQLRLLYSQCSVFCIASIEEGLAMVQAQAMACGLPVIHTTNTGGSDIVRDGLDGYCVPIRDVEALKEKILFFYDNPTLRADMGRNALSQARTALSWKEYGNKIISNYQQILNSRKHAC